MKKLISVFLIAIILSTISFSAFADVDLKSMDVNSLNELRMQIENEILEKGGNIQIASGQYKCGRDITAGSYELALVEDDFAAYNIYAKDGEQIEVDYLDYGSYCRVNLEDGMTLEISHSCYLRKAIAIGF